MKYIKNLVINIFQIDIITSDIEIEDFTFVGANKFRDDVEEIDKDYLKKLKSKMDIFFKNNPNWKEKYFAVLKDLISVISIRILTDNSFDINKINKFDFKNYIINDPYSSFKALTSNENNKIFKKELEVSISKDGHNSYEYAKVIDERFILGEQKIIEELNDEKVNDYFKNFINDRWPIYEEYLIQNDLDYRLYIYTVKNKFIDQKFEDYFKQGKQYLNKEYLYLYYKNVLNKDEDFFASESYLAFLYLINNFNDDNDLSFFKNKNKKIFDEVIKSAELCYFLVYYFHDEELGKELEPYFYSSPYWCYEYVKYILYYGYENLQGINQEIISSIKVYPELYEKILEISKLRNDSSYSFEDIDNFKPEDFNETTIIKQLD